jgi:hypothetical protein
MSLTFASFLSLVIPSFFVLLGDIVTAPIIMPRKDSPGVDGLEVGTPWVGSLEVGGLGVDCLNDSVAGHSPVDFSALQKPNKLSVLDKFFDQ